MHFCFCPISTSRQGSARTHTRSVGYKSITVWQPVFQFNGLITFFCHHFQNWPLEQLYKKKGSKYLFLYAELLLDGNLIWHLILTVVRQLSLMQFSCYPHFLYEIPVLSILYTYLQNIFGPIYILSSMLAGGIKLHSWCF